jgi:hypothetical protein
VLATQIQLTPEEKKVAVEKLRYAYQRKTQESPKQ